MPLDDVGAAHDAASKTPQRAERCRRSRSTSGRHGGRRDRAPVRELDEAVRAAGSADQDRAVGAHSVALDRVELPAALLPVSNSSRRSNSGVNNWTRRLSTSFPILDGGRIKGDQPIARSGSAAGERAARSDAPVRGARHARRVERARARPRRRGKRAAERPSRRSAPTRSIEVRFREGISTQTDLSQSRLLLEQARANRAQAARNLAVARVRLALLQRSADSARAGAVVGASARPSSNSSSSKHIATAQRHSAARSSGGAERREHTAMNAQASDNTFAAVARSPLR